MAVVTKTLRSSGGDYSLMSTWESTEQTDLVSAGDSHVLECYNDWPSGLSDSVTVGGWTTGASNTITIKAAAGEGHGGVVGDGFTITHGSSTTVNAAQSYLTIQDITIESTGTNLALDITGGGGGTEDTFERLIILAESVGATSYAVYGTNTARTHYFRNNLIISSGRGVDFRAWNSSADYHYVDNNTCHVGGAYGFMLRASLNSYSNNVVVGASTEDYYATNTTGSNNASADTTSNSAGSAGVTGISTSDATDFTAPSTNDYSVAGTGSALYDAGTDLSGTFTDDITGATRSQWDIGAYEYVSVGGAANPKGPLGHPLHGPFGGPL